MMHKTEHAIILAAGIGTRLKPLTDHSPKCLTEVNGRSILINTLKNLSTLGIRSCTIVTGYLGEKIKSAANDCNSGVEVRCVRSDVYKKTGDMYSLWLARDVLENGAVILEGDIFFKLHILKEALETMGDRSFYLAGRYYGQPDEVIIKTNGEKKVLSIEVLRVGSVPLSEHTFMSSGILVVQPDYGTAFSWWLSQWVEKNRVIVLFDDVLGDHASDLPLWVYEISSQDWVEIDTIDDLSRAEAIFR